MTSRTVLAHLTMFAVCFGSVTVAQAEGFDVVQNGVVYRCEASQGSTSSSGAVDCATKAYAGPFSKDESMQLCQGARSTGPADCAIKAYAGPFSKDESLRLCVRGDVERANCAISAYAGPYSKDEALKLCAGPHAGLIHRSLMLIEQTPQLQERIQKAKLKGSPTQSNVLFDI